MIRRSLIAVLMLGLTALPVLGLSSPAGAAPKLVWERTFSGQNFHSSPTIGDVDGNGTNDVAVGGQDGWVRVFRSNGRDLPGWPQRVSIGGTNPGMDGSPTIADLDRDGANEVIVGVGTLRNSRQHGGVVVFNRNGSVRFVYQTGDRLEGGNGFSDAVFSTPAVGDVNGDGFPEIVFGSYDHHIHVIDRAGRNLPGAPYYNEDTVWSSPALADVDYDGRAEIFVGADSSAGGQVDHAGGIMHMLEYRDGAVVERWRRYVGEIVISSPALGDIDGDAKPEVVFGTGDFFKTGDNRRVFALNAENGSDAPGWPQSTGGDGWSSPALGDLDGDGRLDVAIGARDGHLYAWRGDGRRLFDVNPSAGTPYTAGIITGGPTILDIDGNGSAEVLSASGNAVFARAGNGGGLVDAFSINWQFQNSTAAGRFGDEWHVVVAGYLESGNLMHVAAYRIPTPRTAPWPMFHHDPAHTGTVPRARTGNGGYWILDTLGDVYAFGDAAHHGSVPGLRAGGLPIGPARTMSMTGTSRGDGYWVLDDKGGMFTFGDAKFFGSVPGLRNAGVPVGDAAVIALAGTTSDGGYWLLDEKGGMFSFGDAKFFGSVPGLRNAGVPIGDARVIGLAASRSGGGYWLLDEKGGMFSFGDAEFFGSVPGLRNAGTPVGPARVVGMAPTRSGNGYWMVDEFGGLFAFGDAGYFGSIPQLRQQGVSIGPAVIVGMVPTKSGNGYWLLDDKGGLFAFGDAQFSGSLPDVGVVTTAVAMTPAGR